MAIDPDLQLPDEPRTAQELWFDAQLRHQIGVIRVVGSIRNQTHALLDATEADLRAAIRDRLRRSRAAGIGSPAALARLQRLLDEVARIRERAWNEVDPFWRDEMTAIAVSEPRFADSLLKTVVPTQLGTALPPASRLRALVTRRPFQGRVLRDWSSSVRQADLRRIGDQIKIGLVQGEGADQIARRVVGTVSLRGRDGVTEITRRNAAAIVRTAANHYANQARREYFLHNADVVDREIYVATLDAATTPICRSLDGQTFPLGEGPIPPLHFSCRSLRTALLDAEAIGSRPMKPVTERMLLREFVGDRGLPAVRRRADLPHGTRGAFDEFARRRTRELIGRVPAKVSYQEFLTRQSREFQDDVLGVTRARLFRRGGLTLRQFVDRAGSEIPLRDLARMHADAFRAAGLDPEAFLRSAA